MSVAAGGRDVAARDQPLLARTRVRCVALAPPARVAGDAAADAPAQTRARTRSRRCCASVCCSFRSCASPSTRRCPRPSTRRRCSGYAARAGSSTPCCGAFSASASSSPKRARHDDRKRRFAHPSWLIDAIRADYPHDWQRMLDANNAAAPDVAARESLRTIRAAPISTSSRRRFGGDGGIREVDSAVRLEEPLAVESLPGFAARRGLGAGRGCAACRAGLLEPRRAERVLDACAAPGGKTGHILEALRGRGEVWARRSRRRAPRPRARAICAASA